MIQKFVNKETRRIDQAPTLLISHETPLNLEAAPFSDIIRIHLTIIAMQPHKTPSLPLLPILLSLVAFLAETAPAYFTCNHTVIKIR